MILALFYRWFWRCFVVVFDVICFAAGLGVVLEMVLALFRCWFWRCFTTGFGVVLQMILALFYRWF